MSDKKEKESVRDLDFHNDFDENGELIDEKMKKHFEAERKALLGDSPVPAFVPEAPPPDPPPAPPADPAHLPKPPNP